MLGPSATWFLRHLADRLDVEPDGFQLDLAECAAAIGLGRHRGPTAAFPRMLSRCCQFRVVRATGPASIEVRRHLAPLSRRQIEKLSHPLQVEHARWADTTPAAAEVAALSDRARRLALSLLELGEDTTAAERQLHRWRFHPAVAREALAWALERHSGAPEPDTEAGDEANRRASAAREPGTGPQSAELLGRVDHLRSPGAATGEPRPTDQMDDIW